LADMGGRSLGSAYDTGFSEQHATDATRPPIHKCRDVEGAYAALPTTAFRPEALAW
jgi:hypothetical protein